MSAASCLLSYATCRARVSELHIRAAFMPPQPRERNDGFDPGTEVVARATRPRLGNMEGVGLAAEPQDLGGFVELGEAIVRSRNSCREAARGARAQEGENREG